MRIDGGVIEEARLVLGAVASQPLLSAEATEFLTGKKLTDDVIEEAGRIMAKLAKPRGNTDLTPIWRKKMVPNFVSYALRELRGDDVQAVAVGEVTGQRGVQVAKELVA